MSYAVRVVSAAVTLHDFELRAPFVYGKGKLTHQKRCEARVVVKAADGREAEGVAQMGIATGWTWPSKTLDADARTRAYLELLTRFGQHLQANGAEGHPLEIYWATKPALPQMAAAVADEQGLAETPPALCQMFCQSPYDLATYDAYGKLFGKPCWDLLGAEYFARDLSHYLGGAFSGKYPADFLLAPQRRVRISHCVGCADALYEKDVADDAPQDGYPNSLEAWIRADGLDAFKLKLNADVVWDAQRVVDVVECVANTRGDQDFYVSVDGNEQYPGAEAVLELLERVRAASPQAFERLAYVEQPTTRDFAAGRIDMKPVTRLKPVIADEAVTRPGDLDELYDLGWSGFGLKAGKSLSGDLLYVAVSRRREKLLTIQDNMNTGLAHAASMMLATYTSPFGGVECNGRQFNPAANDALAERFPKLFKVKDSCISTEEGIGTGLGY